MKTFETGATSHVINDLILFCDNDRETAQLRDKIYKHCISANRKPKQTDFYKLFSFGREQYKKQLPDSYKHLYQVTEQQEDEFCQLYVNDFENWKFDHI